MNDTELAALTAVVNWQVEMIRNDITKYGEIQIDPKTPEVLALHLELSNREITTPPCPTPLPVGASATT